MWKDTVELITFFMMLLFDLIFFFILRPLDFATVNKDAYVIASMFVDPIFIGGLVFGFLAFKKNARVLAFFWAGLPVVTTVLFYHLFT